MGTPLNTVSPLLEANGGRSVVRFPSFRYDNLLARFSDRWIVKRRHCDEFGRAIELANDQLSPNGRLPDAVIHEWHASWVNDLFIGGIPTHDQLTRTEIALSIQDIESLIAALLFVRDLSLGNAFPYWFYESSVELDIGLFPEHESAKRHYPRAFSEDGNRQHKISRTQFLERLSLLFGNPSQNELAWYRRLTIFVDYQHPLCGSRPRYQVWTRKLLATAVPNLANLLKVSYPSLSDDLLFEEVVRRLQGWVCTLPPQAIEEKNARISVPKATVSTSDQMIPCTPSITSQYEGDIQLTGKPRLGEGGKASTDRQKGIPLKEAEIRVSDWLRVNAKGNPARITRDAVAAGSGVSAGQVSRTAAWRAFRDERDAEVQPVRREISLTDAMQAELSSECETPEELAALIEEQQADNAKENRGNKRRHKPS